jgi:hypothetical protein
VLGSRRCRRCSCEFLITVQRSQAGFGNHAMAGRLAESAWLWLDSLGLALGCLLDERVLRIPARPRDAVVVTGCVLATPGVVSEPRREPEGQVAGRDGCVVRLLEAAAVVRNRRVAVAVRRDDSPEGGDGVAPLVQEEGFVVAARVRDLDRLDAAGRVPEAKRLLGLVAEGDDRLEPRPNDRVVELVAPVAVRRLDAQRFRLVRLAGVQGEGMRVDEDVRSGRPSFERKPWTRCPASPTSVRQAIRSVGPGSEAIPSSRADPLSRPR